MVKMYRSAVVAGLAFLGMMGQARADEPAPPPVTQPTDAQIGGALLTTSQVEIDAGKVAEKATKNAEVKAYAEKIVADHSAVHKETTELMKKLKLKPEEDTATKSIRTSGKDSLAKLKKLRGVEFDKAYIDNAITCHQQELDNIDKVLTPSARNEDLKKLLEKVRPQVASHLDDAKKIQGALGAKT